MTSSYKVGEEGDVEKAVGVKSLENAKDDFYKKTFVPSFKCLGILKRAGNIQNFHIKIKLKLQFSLFTAI